MSALYAKSRRATAISVTGFALAAVLVAASGCSPIIRPAPFLGAKDQVTDTSLVGPFDGQIVDAKTGEPLQEAIVVGVWAYDRGDGFIGPTGSETVEVITDAAGRYRIPEAPRKVRMRKKTVRLVSFHLLVYKRGYAAYRSDELFEGGPRRDFTGRHNRIELRKWREQDSHAEHLLFLAAPREIARVAGWERTEANLDLYRQLGGTIDEPQAADGPDAKQPDDAATAPREQTLLDVTGLLPPEDAAIRTGFEGEFEVGELTDLARTYFYQGIHLQAVGQGEDHDIAYRVWHKPAGGMDPVIETLRATLPDVEASAEVTAETWVYDSDDVRAVGFIDRELEVGVLLTCGAGQCSDIDTAIILAKFLHSSIESGGIAHVMDKDAKQPLAPATDPGVSPGEIPATTPEPKTPEPKTPEPDENGDDAAGAFRTSPDEEPAP